MAMNRSITNHEEIREWAAARAGKPALISVPTGTGDAKDTVSFEFGQVRHGSDNNESATHTQRLVEWNEWFAAFEADGLALLVPESVDGQVDQNHQFLKR